jgi:hypothetical protein
LLFAEADYYMVGGSLNPSSGRVWASVDEDELV